MPYIPLSIPKNVGMPGAPVLDREQRPTVNGRGILQGMAALGEASKMPLANPEPFIEAAGSAGLSLGHALIKGGSLLGAMAEKRQSSYDDEQVLNAHADVQMERSRQAAFQAKNLDPSTYEADAAKGWEALNKKWSGVKGLSGDGQRRLGMLLTVNTKTGMDEVAVTAAKAQNQRTASAYKASIGDAMEARNYPEVKRLADESEKGGYSFPHETQYIHKIANNQEKEDTLWTAIKAQPKNGPYFTRDPGFAKKYNLSPYEAELWGNRADQHWADHQHDAVRAIKNGVLSGVIKGPEDLVAYSDDLDEVNKADVVSWMTKAQPVNQAADWNEAYKAIQSLNLNEPEEVKGFKVAQLKTWFETKFDGPMRGEMDKLLEDRLKDSEGIASADMKELADLADREQRLGHFGNYTDIKKDDKGRPLAEVHQDKVIPETVGHFWWKRPGTPADAIDSKEKYATYATEENKVKKLESDTLKRDAIRAVDKWRKEQKTPPTREQLFEKFNEVTKGAVSASDADSFLKGGGPSNALFMFTPDDAAAKLKKGLK